MSVAVLLRIGIVVTGLLIMWQSFYMHAVKKLAINLAVAWEGIGIGLILVGAIPVLSAWCYQKELRWLCFLLEQWLYGVDMS